MSDNENVKTMEQKGEQDRKDYHACDIPAPRIPSDDDDE